MLWLFPSRCCGCSQTALTFQTQKILTECIHCFSHSALGRPGKIKQNIKAFSPEKLKREPKCYHTFMDVRQSSVLYVVWQTLPLPETLLAPGCPSRTPSLPRRTRATWVTLYSQLNTVPSNSAESTHPHVSSERLLQAGQNSPPPCYSHTVKTPWENSISLHSDSFKTKLGGVKTLQMHHQPLGCQPGAGEAGGQRRGLQGFATSSSYGFREVIACLQVSLACL